MRRPPIVRRAAIIATSIISLVPAARSGHELPVYPSYYPHEIEIARVDPSAASRLISDGKMHAYVGPIAEFAAGRPDAINAVASLGSMLIIKLNPNSALANDQGSACAAVASILRGFRERTGELIIHPYPVTPLHGDYLYHADLAEAAGRRLTQDYVPLGGLKVRPEGARSQSLIAPDMLAKGDEWDAAVEEVEVSTLVSGASVASNGWLGPRWVRMGWFHAYRLLAKTLDDAGQRERVEAEVARLMAGSYENALERINLERDLVKSLTSRCRALPAGYTLKREYLNGEFSAGVENVGYDALEGLHSPMFLRTVKLKDFPWNGWLQLGIGTPAQAAWNPVAGFSDDFGRLMWFAIGDPAVMPSPYDANWIVNRFAGLEATPH